MTPTDTTPECPRPECVQGRETRADFEGWYAKRYGGIPRDSNPTWDNCIKVDAWEVWQAATEAVVQTAPSDDKKIVEQAETVASMLAYKFHGSSLVEGGITYRNTSNRKAHACWVLAREIQKYLVGATEAIRVQAASSGWKTINVNNVVKVKLNEHGLKILREQRADLVASLPEKAQKAMGEYSPPYVDKEGWSRFQLWILMNHFGPYMQLGAHMPFDSAIQVAAPPLPMPGEPE